MSNPYQQPDPAGAHGPGSDQPVTGQTPPYASTPTGAEPAPWPAAGSTAVPADQTAYPPPTQGYPPPTQAYPSASGAASKGFFGSLFDFSFNSFITPIIVKVVYVLVFIAVILTWIIGVVAGFSRGGIYGILAVVFGAIGSLLYLCFARMILEFFISVVRMSQDIHQRLPGR